jgi:hypothetical protein
MNKWHLQIEPGTWVLWGYGPGRQVVHVDRSKIDLGHGIVLPFKLPKDSLRSSRGDSTPQEYERLKGYGWRWNIEDGTAGHSWTFADTIDEAVEAASQRLEGQRRNTQVLFTEALRDVRIGGKRRSTSR